MGGKTRREESSREQRLRPEVMECRDCGERLRLAYSTWRKVATLEGMLQLKVSIGRCVNPACARYHLPTHPLEEGHIALPYYEYGLDVLAFIGRQRYCERSTAAQIHAALEQRAVRISQRNVQYLLERYDELVALSVRDSPERRARLAAQGRLILAIDGLQPDVGHEVLWVIREVLSGEVLLARSLLSSCQAELIALL
ncbi:transposase, partial [Thiorhodococcus mannitoliphagus]|nr:transposase [Thiorhodococcus mannitoliphagus]